MNAIKVPLISGFTTTKLLFLKKEMDIRTRGAPDLSGSCFQMSSNMRPFVNCWWNRNQLPADADTQVFPNDIIYFHILQEVLQCGRSFEVEKILSDERYRTLKVSRRKKNSNVRLLSPRENDLHLLTSLEDLGLLKTLNANPPLRWACHFRACLLDYVLTSFPASCSRVCLGLDLRRLRSGTAEGCAHSLTFWQTAAFI